MTPLESIAAILEVPASTLQEDELLDNVDSWDSLAALSFIAMADADYSRTVSGQQLRESRTVGDLVRLLGSALA